MKASYLVLCHKGDVILAYINGFLSTSQQFCGLWENIEVEEALV